jgi:hypothetical protein
MDLSKLPKLSKTDPPPPAEESDQVNDSQRPAASSQPVLPYEPQREGVGIIVWFNTIIGLLAIAWGKNVIAYVFDRIAGKQYVTGATWTADAPGHVPDSPVSYPDLDFGMALLTDSSLVLFGFAVLGEALVNVLFASGKLPRALLLFLMMISIVATAFNLYVSIRLISAQTLPLISGLCLAFGGWIVADEWKILMQLSTRPRERRA